MRIRTPKIATKFIAWMSKIQGFNIAGFAIHPWIFIKSSREEYENGPERWDKVVRHESIHWYQAVCLGVLPFYILYALDYLLGLLIHWNHYDAYMSVVFEKEAYANDDNPEYIDFPDAKLWESIGLGYRWVNYILPHKKKRS